jgi:hypothetical protein
MKILTSAACAVLLLTANGLTTAPAIARPLHIVVRGANPIYPPDYSYDYAYGGDAAGDQLYDLYGSPFERGYGPAGKVPDSNYYGPPAVSLVLAGTLDRNGESILGHIMHCQASFPSYNAATNFYSGRHGQPMTCYR